MPSLLKLRGVVARILTAAANRVQPTVDSDTTAVTAPAFGNAKTVRKSPEEQIREAISLDFQVILIHGKAGTGKTTVLKSLMKERSRQAAVAFTGVAAMNAGGQTINSLFGMPPRLFAMEELKPSRTSWAILTQLDRLIIDEMSMVRADMIDGIDHVLRRARNPNLPFGGVRLILIGDPLQLTPIVKKHEEEILSQAGYASQHFFRAKALQQLRMRAIELTHVHRQHDLNFLELLAGIREANDLGRCVSRLNEICCRPHRHTIPVLLTARNADADSHNAQELASLDAAEEIFSAIVEGEFDLGLDRVPVPQTLCLKVGARVMLAKNDPGRRWVNGTVGVVDHMEQDRVFVRIDEIKEPVQIQRELWENVRYLWDNVDKKIKTRVVGKYTQLPLQLAWALTIHKSQGLTLNDVRLDLGQGVAFATGQVYVALSRVRTIEGLSFKRPLRIADVKTDAVMIEAIRRLRESA